MRWPHRRSAVAALPPSLPAPNRVPVLRIGTCPKCASARHKQVFEEDPDGDLHVRRGCLLCGTVWTPFEQSGPPDEQAG